MFGRRAKVNGDGEVKPLTVQERLNLLETGEVLLKYPIGLIQPYSRQELTRLKKRFVQLIPAQDTSRNLQVQLEVVLQIPELRAQPFVPLVAQLVLDRQPKNAVANEQGNQDAVSFSVFVTILAVFSVKQSLEFKRKLFFDIYDQDNKGCVTVDDFLRVISTVSRANAARKLAIREGLERHLTPFVRKTNGGVSGILFSDFNQLFVDEEILNSLTIMY